MKTKNECTPKKLPNGFIIPSQTLIGSKFSFDVDMERVTTLQLIIL